jgi:hypothetical protein
VGTLREFAEGIAKLNSNPDFSKIIEKMETAEQQQWSNSVEYFKQNKSYWQKLRNDLGGHFSHDASRFVVKNLEHDSYGRIEAQLSDEGVVGFSLPFAWEIASLAFLRNLNAATKEAKVKELIEKITEAYEMAILPTIALIVRRAW